MTNTVDEHDAAEIYRRPTDAPAAARGRGDPHHARGGRPRASARRCCTRSARTARCMLHLAMKAFYPSTAAVPAGARRHDLEVQRDVRLPRRARPPRLGLELIVHQNPECIEQEHQPVRSRLGDCTPTCGRPRASSRSSTSTSSTCVSAAPAATRRSRGPRSGCSRSAPRSTSGTRSASAPSCGSSTTRGAARARRCACSRSRTGPNSTSGSTSTSSRSRSCRSTLAQPRPVVERDGTLIMVDDDRMPLDDGEVPDDARTCGSARSAATR